MTDDAATAEEVAESDEPTAERTETADTSEESDELPPELGLDFDAAATDAEFPDDERRRRFLRGIAEEIRAESSESRQLSAILYRISDLYDSDEDTSPEEIYLNVRNIMQVKARGGLDR
ncbi:MAG: hypothetical protein ABEI99_02515 [Halobaculum sp.]